MLVSRYSNQKHDASRFPLKNKMLRRLPGATSSTVTRATVEPEQLQRNYLEVVGYFEADHAPLGDGLNGAESARSCGDTRENSQSL